MALCHKFDSWVTMNVLVPVERFIYESQEVCEQVQRWAAETVWDRVESFIQKQEKFCHDLPWPLDWICDVVVTIEKVVTYVPRTVWNLVTDTICKVIMKIIGSFIDLVTRTIAWMITTLVCFTSPLDALAKLLDLWRIVMDGIADILDVIGGVIDVGRDFVDDFSRFLDSLGETLGPLAWLLTPWKAIAKWADVLLGASRDFVDGIKDVVKGIGNFNLCASLRGFSNIAGALVGAAVNTGVFLLLPFKGLGMWYGAGRDVVDAGLRDSIIRENISAAFSTDPGGVQRSITSLNLGTTQTGRRFAVTPYRMYVSSKGDTPNLRELHEMGVLDLYALAGYVAGCPDVLNQPEGEVVYADSPLAVTFAHIRQYLNDNPEDVPEFWVFAITIDRYRRHLFEAQRKASYLGVQYVIQPFGVYRAHSSDHVPLNCSLWHDQVQQQVFKELGRIGTRDEDLSVIPLVAHFHYVTQDRNPDTGNVESVPELNGLTSVFRLPAENVGSTHPNAMDEPSRTASGVTYRSHSPDTVFRWTVPHELGHYLGIPHAPWGVSADAAGDPINDSDKRTFDEIMYSRATGRFEPGSVLFEYLVAGGEPRFTVGDIRYVWKWITKDAAKSLLP